MNGIIKAEDLPQDEKIYLKKDMFGWRIVNPIKNEDGSINWVALLIGNVRNLITLIFIFLIMLGIMYAYSHDVNEIKARAEECLDNPVEYCQKVLAPTTAIKPLGELRGVEIED